jgi:signal peptidase I
VFAPTARPEGDSDADRPTVVWERHPRRDGGGGPRLLLSPPKAPRRPAPDDAPQAGVTGTGERVTDADRGPSAPMADSTRATEALAPAPVRRARPAPRPDPDDDPAPRRSAGSATRTGGATRRSTRGAATGVKLTPARQGSFLRELPFLLIIAVVLALLVKSLVVQAFYIPSRSMEPTLAIGDRVLVNRLAFRFGEPEHGDVVVFFRPDPDAGKQPTGVIGFLKRAAAQGLGNAPPGSEDLIKRVIGKPGDVLFARNGKLWRNGEQLNETYLRPETKTSSFGPVRVPEGHIWVMGDNREDSQDSRKFGPVDEEVLVGRAMVLIWPFDHVGKL